MKWKMFLKYVLVAPLDHMASDGPHCDNIDKASLSTSPNALNALTLHISALTTARTALAVMLVLFLFQNWIAFFFKALAIISFCFIFFVRVNKSINESVLFILFSLSFPLWTCTLTEETSRRNLFLKNGLFLAVSLLLVTFLIDVLEIWLLKARWRSWVRSGRISYCEVEIFVGTNNWFADMKMR